MLNSIHLSDIRGRFMNPEIKTRDPIDFMDCLLNLRKDRCVVCSFRKNRLGNWEQCPKRVAMKYN